jgi:PAS domain S-box-containing protein
MSAQKDASTLQPDRPQPESRPVSLSRLSAPNSSRAADDLRVLYEAGKLLSSTFSIHEIYDRLRELVARNMSCDGMIVSSFNPDDEMIRCEYVWVKGTSADPADFPPIKLAPAGLGMQTQVIRSGEPELFSDVRRRVQDGRGTFYDMGPDGELKPAGPETEHPQTRTALMVPIKRDDRTIGVLQVMSDKHDAYSWDDLALLEALLSQVTVAIHNAALFEEAQRQIEERTRAENRALESSEMLRLAMRGGRMGAWQRDLETDLVLWTPELEELFGAEIGSFAGSEPAFFEFVHPDDVPMIAADVRAAIEERRDYSVEFRFQHTSGEWRWIEGRGRATYDDAGRPVRLYGIGIDITDRKRQEAEIVALNASLRRAMAESHHRIKNNLQVLSALINVQLEDNAETVARSAMERLNAHVRSLAALHELLTLKFAGSDSEVVSLQELLEKLAPLLRAAAGGREIVVEADDVGAPLRQAGSFSMLVNELVSNAVKHGQGTISVTLRSGTAPGLRERAAEATLEVADEGPGIPDGFDPQKAGNTGIGLITTLSTWDLQGSVRWLRSDAGGTTVAVRFPIGPDIQ